MSTEVQVEPPKQRSRSSSVTTPTATAQQPREWKEDVSSWKILAQGAQRANKVQRFYDKQAENINAFLALDEEQKKNHLARADGTVLAPEAEVVDSRIALAIRGSLLLNIVLCFVKGYTLYISGSLVVAASLVDSVLDLLSGGILVVVSYLRVNLGREKFPTGTHRFEPLGTLIFSCLMCMASSKLMEQCLVQIITADVGLESDPLIFIAAIIVCKFIAWMLCRQIADLSVSVEALADDHRNDCFSNGIGIVAIFCANQWWAYIDPLVALLTSTAIMILWSRSAYLQIKSLSGEMAPPQVLNALTLLARNHDERVVAVDTVRAVTGGDGFVVEIDLVLPPTMSLKEAHDIGESLQMFLESLKSLDIARAYVHLDYEVEHNPAHHR